MSSRRAGTRLPSWRMLHAEADRDQQESSFTPILRRLWAASPGILAVTFVDDEGECVDYCASIPAFDAKVAGAHMSIVVDVVRRAVPRLGGGEMHALEVYGASHEIVARRVGPHYVLSLLAEAGTLDVRVLDQLESTVAELRREADVEMPAWDPQAEPLGVEVREAVGWDYAPEAFVERGRRVQVADVLGRWVERGGVVGGELSCFRVRTQEGVELTLTYDAARDRWSRR